MDKVQESKNPEYYNSTSEQFIINQHILFCYLTVDLGQWEIDEILIDIDIDITQAHFS
jgi:hypothetical protein